MKKPQPWGVLLGLITTAGLGWLTTPLDALIPSQAKVITGVAAIVLGAASFLKAYYDLLNAPAQAVAAEAPVVNEAGVKIGTNVSDTSAILVDNNKAK